MNFSEVGLTVMIAVIAMGLAAWVKEWISLRWMLVLLGVTAVAKSFGSIEAQKHLLADDGAGLGVLIVVPTFIVLCVLCALIGPPRAYTQQLMRRIGWSA